MYVTKKDDSKNSVCKKMTQTCILIWEKNYLATLSSKQTPAETDSKTKIQKNQPCIDKNPKIAGKHQQKNIPKNTHQTCSPSKLAG